VLFAKCNLNDQVKKDEMGRACSTHGAKDVSRQGFGVKPQGRTRRRWEDNIKLDLGGG
jgi:hypothetical protein